MNSKKNFFIFLFIITGIQRPSECSGQELAVAGRSCLSFSEFWFRREPV
jgi:hypothetical protein